MEDLLDRTLSSNPSGLAMGWISTAENLIAPPPRIDLGFQLGP